MLAELEGDCSADHRLLPFKRRGEAARPGAPFIGGAVEHRLDGGLHIAGKAFVRTEEEVQRPLDPKPLLVPEAAHGRARRQPQDRKSTRLNSRHKCASRMPSSA